MEILRTFSFQIQANDIDFKDITREEAVLILLSLGDEVNLLCKYGRESKHCWPYFKSPSPIWSLSMI